MMPEIQIEDVEHVGVSRDPSAHLHKKIFYTAQRAAQKLRRGNARRRQDTKKQGRGFFVRSRTGWRMQQACVT